MVHYAYGGTLSNRTRFTLEVVNALCSVRGAEQIGVKIAPGFTVNDTFDDNPAETYTYVAKALSPLGLAYLHVGYDRGYARGTAPEFNPIDLLRPVYQGTLLAVGGFDRHLGDEAIMNGRADAIVFGRLFISNPHSAPSTVTIGFYLFLTKNKAINYTFIQYING